MEEFMDLHIHSNYSDGVYNVSDLLKMAEEKHLSTIAITDHNCCLAYYDFLSQDVRNLFSGNIKTGIEISTSFMGIKIELLAYDFDNFQDINSYFTEFKNNIDWETIMPFERKILLQKFDNLGILYPDNYKNDFMIDRYETKIYEDILNMNSDSFLKEVLGSWFCEVPRDFYRKSICNPMSPFYIDFVKYKPKIHDVIKLIHDNGGKLFLAHPFNYRLDGDGQLLQDMPNCINFIESLFDNYSNIDGIECYYYSFTKEQIDFVNSFAEKRQLLISGGSDFHGSIGRNGSIGFYLNGDKMIPQDIIKNWK